MKKKVLSFILGISISCGLLSGCSSNKGSNTDISNVGEVGVVVDNDNTSNEVKDKLDDYILFMSESEGWENTKDTYYYNADGSLANFIYIDYDEEIGNYRKYENEFDNKGNLLKTTGYGSDGTIIEVMQYDEKGDLISYLDTWYDEEPELYDYEYDNKGRLVKLVTTTPNMYNTTQTITTYTYDKENRIIEETITNSSVGESVFDTEMENSDFSLTYRYTYEYDEDGRLLTRTEYDGFGNEVCVINGLGISLRGEANGYDSEYDFEHIFDENGYLVSYVEYDDLGNIENEYEFENDKDGNVIKIYQYSDNGICLRELSLEYERDDKGNITEIKVYDGDRLQRKLECIVEYDEDGNLIHESKHIPYFGDFNIRVDYGYDSKGNLTKEAVGYECYGYAYVDGYSYIFDESDESIIHEKYSQYLIERKKYVKKNTDFDSLIADVNVSIEKFLNNAWRNDYIEWLTNDSVYEDAVFGVVDIDGNGVNEIIGRAYEGGLPSYNFILSYSGNSISYKEVEDGGFYYVPDENKLGLHFSGDGQESRIYELIDGNFVTLLSGKYIGYLFKDDEEYILDGRSVTEDEYRNAFGKMFDRENLIGFEMNYEEMINFLENDLIK